jgi:hypothetical protein
MTRRSHRPTLAPTYDVEEYARESERLVRSARNAPESDREFPAHAASEVRLITRPQWGAIVTNEAWARGMTGSPYVTMSSEALKRLPLDHRAGFVISLMDGTLDLDTLVELSGMSRDDALGLVRNLFDSGIVEFR